MTISVQCLAALAMSPAQFFSSGYGERGVEYIVRRASIAMGCFALACGMCMVIYMSQRQPVGTSQCVVCELQREELLKPEPEPKPEPKPVKFETVTHEPIVDEIQYLVDETRYEDGCSDWRITRGQVRWLIRTGDRTVSLLRSHGTPVVEELSPTLSVIRNESGEPIDFFCGSKNFELTRTIEWLPVNNDEVAKRVIAACQTE